MPTASESRRALTLVTAAAIEQATQLLDALTGPPEAVRSGLLEAVPEVIAYYSLGSSALAADFYDEERDRADVRRRFLAEPVIPDRGEKIARAIVWAAEPLFAPAEQDAPSRLAEVVQLETARPYRDTITTNRRRDPSAVGWRRIAESGCRFCRMLAGRGAVYKAETARFASHTHCHCTAAPVFKGQDGPEASALQYVASKRRKTEADRARVRAYLADMGD